MAFATESTTTLTLKDFKTEPVEVRFGVYMGIAAAALTDVSKVDDQSLRLLSYGYFRDTEVREAVGDDSFYAGFQPIFDSVKEQGDEQAIWELMQGDRVEDEGMQIPATAVALVAAFYGGAALAGAVGSVGTPIGAAAGAGSGVSAAQGIVASAATPAMLLASKITGVLPTGVIAAVAKWGSGIGAAVGVPGLGFSIWNEIANTDEAEKGRADTIAQRDAYGDMVAGVDEGYTQEEMDARERYMGNEPAQIDGTVRGMAGKAAGAAPRAGVVAPEPGSTTSESASYERPAGQYKVGPPTNVPGYTTVAGQDLVGTPAPIGPQVVDPNADNPYIGALREGYQAHVRETIKGTGQEVDYYTTPQYRQSDFEYVQSTLTERTIDWFQDKMVHAGYMKEDQATGLMDAKTIDTMERVMYEANVNGKSWRNWSIDAAEAGDELQALEDASAKQARLDAIGPFQRRVYLEPDYATLATNAKNAMERELGRQINDWEMAMLVDEQQSDYREDYEAQVQADRYSYDDQVRAIEDDLGVGDVTGGQTVQGVDPGARFQQTFESQFEKELNRRSKTVDAEERTSTLMQGLNNAMSAMGGR